MPVNKLPDPPIFGKLEDPEWRQWLQALFKWQRQEGYFTPTFTGLTIGGVGGAVTHYAHWYKQGNRVWISGYMAANGTATITFGNFGTTYITNPPFTVAPANNSLPINGYSGQYLSSATTPITGQVWAFGDSSTNRSRIYFTPGGPTTAGNLVYWTLNYQTDA
jgi:hypothetical protein